MAQAQTGDRPFANGDPLKRLKVEATEEGRHSCCGNCRQPSSPGSIRSREISARGAVQAALDRLNDVNDTINAVVDHRPEEALMAADVIDARLRDGGEVGVLAGVPVTVKVNVDQAGDATTEGVTLQRDNVAKTNNPVVDNLLKAGAVIIGRTNAPAFCLRWFTSNRLYGETRNPRDFRLTPGGSSGGAAAAVTAGIGAIAHGTDIAGSIRYPAYACGVHGLRPTLGRVPTFNPFASGAHDRTSDHRRVWPVGAQHRRPPPGTRCDGGGRCPRPMVGARAADRTLC